jgi:hypothetical protein
MPALVLDDYPTPITEPPWTIRCPHCGAEPGTICVDPKGQPYFWSAHVARVKAAQ